MEKFCYLLQHVTYDVRHEGHKSVIASLLHVGSMNVSSEQLA